MARVCGYELADGTRCQVETEGAHCELHLARLNRSDVSSPALIRQHLQTNQGTVIDLKGFRFRALDFESTLFPPGRDILFDDSTFVNSRFIDVAFEGNVSFANCTFEGTIFENVCSNDSTIGCAKLDFTLAKFLGGEVPFRDCSFYACDEILFVDATFESKEPPFTMCHAKSDLVSFMGASINAERFALHICKPDLHMLMPSSLVLDASHINLARLKCNGHFEYGNLESMIDVSPFVSLIYVDFRQMQTATFRNANLTKVLFLGSPVDNVVFANPRWTGFGTSRRVCVFDDTPDEAFKHGAPLESESSDSSEFVEIDWDDRDRENTRLNQLLELYVSLKKNFEASGNYIDAGDWFYREMECRRRLIAVNRSRIVRWLRQNFFSFPPWYRFVSEYGENYTRPMWGLLATLVLGAVSYFYSGFGTDHTINYDFAWTVTGESFWGLVDAMLYSLGVMSFQVTKTGFQHGTVTATLTLAQVVLTLILVPLFLLALRRKFRR